MSLHPGHNNIDAFIVISLFDNLIAMTFTVVQISEQFHLIGFHFYGLDLLQVGRQLQAKVSQLPQTQVDRRLPILLMQDDG